jgi:hypothetical protein
MRRDYVAANDLPGIQSRGIEEVVRMFEHEARAGIFDGT